MTPRVSLARLPTPLERLERFGPRLGLDLWIKRDDLSGLELSGNKVRKLEYLVGAALAEGADTLITCGGVNSNHARATAVAAARVGLRSLLVLRGEDRRPPAGNLLLDRVLGAELRFITVEQWRERDAIMAACAAELAASGRRAYVIPEGGSNALGALGYADAVAELLAQKGDAGSLVHAVGSGGTTAGLALGLARVRREDIALLGVAVCDDAAYFDAKIHAILDAAVAAGHTDRATRARARWRIVEGYKGRGYALTTPAEMTAHAALARSEAVFVDPVYTGKAMLGLAGEAAAGRIARDRPVVFWHTGGIFELFAYASEIDSL